MAGVLRGGVVGAGVFGGYHARQYAQQDGTVLSAVLDPDPERAAKIAMELGGRAFTELEPFLDAVDLVTVASPATVHADHAKAALEAGKPIYVEKPIAVTMADAEAIRALAEAKGLVVACGHQERVVFRAMGLLDVPEQPRLLEAVRHGMPSERCQDVSSVLDLMVHDIDLALSLSAAQPAPQDDERFKVSGNWDVIRAEIGFDDGFTAIFDMSRQAPARRRTMRVVYPSGEVEIDFLERTFRNTTPFPLNPDFAETPAGRDPLGASLQSFIMAVRGEAPRPIVDADEAILALDLALKVEQAADLRAPA